MTLIFHITSAEQWHAARCRGSYTSPSLERQGFIHCSTKAQVVGVANHLFKGEQDLLLLCIDEGQITARVVYENLHGGSDLFPHIYGPLNLDAVMETVAFPVTPDGKFVLPRGIHNLD